MMKTDMMAAIVAFEDSVAPITTGQSEKTQEDPNSGDGFVAWLTEVLVEQGHTEKWAAETAELESYRERGNDNKPTMAEAFSAGAKWALALQKAASPKEDTVTEAKFGCVMFSNLSMPSDLCVFDQNKPHECEHARKLGKKEACDYYTVVNERGSREPRPHLMSNYERVLNAMQAICDITIRHRHVNKDDEVIARCDEIQDLLLRALVESPDKPREDGDELSPRAKAFLAVKTIAEACKGMRPEMSKPERYFMAYEALQEMKTEGGTQGFGVVFGLADTVYETKKMPGSCGQPKGNPT